MCLRQCVHGAVDKANDVILLLLKLRFSSIESRSPTTPHSPGGNDQHQIYPVQNYEDNVFADEKPKFDVPPTPGTAPVHHFKTGGSNRKLRTRDIILIVVGVVLIVGLAVGAAVAVIFLKKDSSSLSSSTHTPLLASTTSPTETSASEASTPSSTPSIFLEDIHYDGHLNLSLLWETTVVELENLFVNDMEAIIAASPLYKSFIKSSLLNISANEKLSFTLDFKRSLLEIFNETDEITDNSLAQTVQTILREKVVTNAGIIKLPIKADTIIILENIPVSTTTTVSLTMSVSTSTEAEIKGPCLSLTFEPCHSLLGSSYFYLPNVLHHTSTLQAEDAYQELSRHPMNASCAEFSLLYLCSLLFPACDSISGVPIYPCDTLCTTVGSECGILNDWPQNCDDFPKFNCRALDIKSTSKSSSASTTTASANTVTGSTMVSTKTAISAPTSTSTVTENQINFQCVAFDFSLCNALGFMETVLPSPVFHCKDIQCLTEIFINFTRQSVENGCTSDLTFFCAYTFQGCNKDNLSDPIRPCFDMCIDAVQLCGSFMPQQPDCSEFNRPHRPCNSPTVTGLATTMSPSSEICIDQTFSFCASEGFLRTPDKSIFGDTLEDRIDIFHNWAMQTVVSGCSDLAKFFYCGIFFPKCEDNKKSVPCQRYCNDVMSKCPNSTFPYDCSELVDDECLQPMPSSSVLVNTVATATSQPVSTTTTSTTTFKSQCEPLQSPLCSQFGYTHTSFPNLWGSKSIEEANKTYYMVAEKYVSAGCSPNILFYVCTMLFPYCEGDGTLKLPCTSVCEEVNRHCFHDFQQECVELSESKTDQCLAPPKKIACRDSEFACVNINKCVPHSAVCNRKNDCGDWSDERNCTCNGFETPCDMGLCIPSYFLCDNTSQCPDNSDENNCECPKNQYKCENESRCIMPEWLCDGFPDCFLADDEHFCRNCTKDEFMCLDNVCIPKSQACDGTPQCADHSDEMLCIYKGSSNQPLFIKSNTDEVVMICSDGFTNAHGQTACLKMGEASLKNWTAAEYNFHEFFQPDPNGNKMSVIGRGKIVNNCTSGAVAVDCNPRECGHPSEMLLSYIINGEDANPGYWPWMVSIRKSNTHLCGGAIIHPYFILTAAHCFETSLDYSLIKIVAGTIYLKDSDQQRQERKVRRIISHPQYKYLKGYDIALLELKKPLEYSYSVKPLCLPEHDDVFTRTNQCYIAGWGHTKGVGGQNSDRQKQAKMTLWDTEKCNSSYVWNGHVLANEKCAGYYNGLIAVCSGDSGSPVVCLDETRTWKGVGIASYVYKTCSVVAKPMVYTPIQFYIDWIKNQTVLQFTCDDGISLFEKGMLCDTVNDCEDKSDEIRLCDVRANCSFSDKFLCGYNSSWKLVSSGSSQIVKAGSTQDVNRYPLFDHTNGGFPGMFLLGRNRGDDFKSPRIDLTTRHCMRFHYHMRGKVDQGMAVYVHNLNKNWSYVWNKTKTIGPDKWLMGMFDLEPGHFDIVFRSHDSRRFALDDMWLIEGQCKTMSCLEGEFMCMTFGTKNCLPLAVKCNIVVDCDNGEDEKDCAAPVYLCDFENGNICGLEQHTDDTALSEWILVNSSSTPRNLPDHTFGNTSGKLLKVKTEYLLESDQVLMSQQLNLDNVEHCLKFYYASTSPVTLQVVLERNNVRQNLIKFTNRKTKGWISTQADLPVLSESIKTRLIYEVVGGKLGSGTVEQAIMLDDISITRGRCPTFICPAGTMLCSGEAFCVSEEQVCNRIIDCNNGTDEINCECTTTEFKCPYGSCIPKTQTCNLIENCPDGSDEGTVCDHKRSVSCDFEDAFICGYKVSTSVNEFHWDRTKGGLGDPHTGPSGDHTSLSKDNVVGFYVVANGQRNGDNTSLQSISFISSGYGVVFYYHARHTWHASYMTGRLSVFVTFISNGTQKELWSNVPDSKDEWKYVCLDLPEGNISISYVVQRGSGTHADIALDDILLLDTSCDMFSKSGRIVNVQPTTSSPITSPGCKKTERACRNQMCLDSSLFCDNVRDCLDGSDEFDCDN